MIENIPGVLEVKRLGSPSPTLVIEVPHGADQRAHFDALRARLRGPFPEELEAFFFINTDVGAWDLACAVGEGLAERGLGVLLLRCLLPRTFVDCNRVLGAKGAGLTSGLPGYVRHPADRALLSELHRRYVEATTAAIDVVLGAGGLGLFPHSYAPRSVDIGQVDEGVVARLRAAWADPERWPLRPEVDLLTRDGDRRDLSLPGAAEMLTQRYAALGVQAEVSRTYWLHPVTQAWRHATRYPGRCLCLELRRDLLMTAWRPFEPMTPDLDAIRRLAGPLIETLAATEVPEP